MQDQKKRDFRPPSTSVPTFQSLEIPSTDAVLGDIERLIGRSEKRERGRKRVIICGICRREDCELTRIIYE